MASDIEPFYRELGRKVREIRDRRGMTQEELGQLLNPQVTRASIANVENGTQRVLVHTLSQLATRLDVSVDELLPRVRGESNDQLEAMHITKELTHGLKMPTDQVQNLLRKLTRH